MRPGLSAVFARENPSPQSSRTFVVFAKLKASSLQGCKELRLISMQALQDFQMVARENGFVEAEESEGGSALWFRNVTPDAGSQVHKRLCLDSITKSATIFWESVPVKLNSMTFRSASALRTWLQLKVGSPA
jgi:hypothetical protein